MVSLVTSVLSAIHAIWNKFNTKNLANGGNDAGGRMLTSFNFVKIGIIEVQTSLNAHLFNKPCFIFIQIDQGFFDGFAEIGEFRHLLGTCLSKSIDIYAKV